MTITGITILPVGLIMAVEIAMEGLDMVLMEDITLQEALDILGLVDIGVALGAIVVEGAHALDQDMVVGLHTGPEGEVLVNNK